MRSTCPRTSSPASATGRFDRLQHASARAAKAGKDFGEQLHAMDYLVYAYLQLAQDEKARAVIDEMIAVTGINPDVFAGPLCDRRVAGALRGRTRRLEGRGGAAGPADQFAQVDGDDAFRRALGAARSGNPDAAKADIAKLVELRDKLREAKDAYWAEQVDIQWQIATAWAALCRGQA